MGKRFMIWGYLIAFSLLGFGVRGENIRHDPTELTSHGDDVIALSEGTESSPSIDRRQNFTAELATKADTDLQAPSHNRDHARSRSLAKNGSETNLEFSEEKSIMADTGLNFGAAAGTHGKASRIDETILESSTSAESAGAMLANNESETSLEFTEEKSIMADTVVDLSGESEIHGKASRIDETILEFSTSAKSPATGSEMLDTDPKAMGNTSGSQNSGEVREKAENSGNTSQTETRVKYISGDAEYKQSTTPMNPDNVTETGSAEGPLNASTLHRKQSENLFRSGGYHEMSSGAVDETLHSTNADESSGMASWMYETFREKEHDTEALMESAIPVQVLIEVPPVYYVTPYGIDGSGYSDSGSGIIASSEWFEYRHTQLLPDYGVVVPPYWNGHPPQIGTDRIESVKTEPEEVHLTEVVGVKTLHDYVESGETRVLLRLRLRNGTKNYTRTYVKTLCGLPPFYDCAKVNFTGETKLEKCEKVGLAVLFISAMTLCGTAIVLANSLLPLVLMLDRSSRNRHNYIKCSLAFVDMLVGWYVLCCILPNTVWYRRQTQASVLDYVIQSNNTPRAITLGALLSLTTQISVFHLMFLAVERFVAIKWPFWHYRLRLRSVALPIMFIWAFCILEACLPAMLGDYFKYEFHALLLIYTLVSKRVIEGLDVHGIVYTIVTVVLPYGITVMFIVWTSVSVLLQLRRRKRLINEESSTANSSTQVTKILTDANAKSERTETPKPTRRAAQATNRLRQELGLLKTTIVMVVAYSLSTLPSAIVYALHIGGRLDCNGYSLPYFAAVYIRIANSLSNVIIYSARDEKFRKSLRKIFKFRDCKKAISVHV